MSKPRIVGPACLACSYAEQCSSCAAKPAQDYPTTRGRVGRLQFVAVDKRRPDTNMHFAIRRPFDLLKGDLSCPLSIETDIDPEENCRAFFSKDLAGLGYKNEELIAATSNSFVFRASARGFQGPVAIKMLRRKLLDSRCGNKVFIQEAGTVAQLNHPNIAALYDFGFDSDLAPYMVSKYVPGLTLRELNMKGASLEPLGLFIQICEALAYAHQFNVIHGRLSASKIIAAPVRKDLFVAKIIDFSVTSALEWQLPFSTESLRESVSPEENFGQDPDLRSDIFSLGYVMYEVLTGSPPVFNRARKATGFPSLRGAAKMLQPLVVRCLAYEPNDRYGSVFELLQALRDIESANV
jgi:eukaryotic-like serine/threonine-protein kinase